MSVDSNGKRYCKCKKCRGIRKRTVAICKQHEDEGLFEDTEYGS